jgi:hypothetical protein
MDRTFEARELCARLTDEYERLYYRGLVAERSGKASLGKTGPRVRYIAYHHYRKAMDFYEKAEKLRPVDNQDVVLRWNACVRTLSEFKLEPSPEEDTVEPLLDV